MSPASTTPFPFVSVYESAFAKARLGSLKSIIVLSSGSPSPLGSISVPTVGSSEVSVTGLS